MKYSMFIGRWQTWSAEDSWLIEQRLKQNKNILICIKDGIPDQDNPLTSQEILELLRTKLSDLIQSGKVHLMIIPDIESVNFGRDVGYEIIQHSPSKTT
tara:strand:- start:112 stop:408 length:297 start_codon:yes stop_codon:yes gene_type:complete